jgi:methyl-accepting chemotaxis protein
MKSFTLRHILIGLVVFLGLVLVSEMGLIFTYTASISAKTNHFAKVETPILNKANELKVAVIQVQQYLQDISATRGQNGLDSGFSEAENNARLFRNLLKELQGLDPVNAQRYQAMEPVFETYYATGQRMAQLYVAQGPAGGNPLMEEFDAAADKMTEQVDGFLADAQQRIEHASSGQIESINILRTVILAGFGILAGVLLVVGWVSRSVMRLLGGEPAEMAMLAQQIAQGNLTVRFENTGKETGIYAAMRDMALQLKKMVAQITQATAQVGSAAAEIAQGSADLAQRTEQQASALEQTASSMEELTSTVKHSADNAGQANQIAVAARSQAEQGGRVVEQAIAAMNAINASSREIADIIGVIDEIAFQTNLLALNAAVEAARAGEQGRGFAVVAGEVRKLAQRSADAAKQIKTLITNSVIKVEDGERLVKHSGQTLQEIVTAVKKASDIVAEIAAAAREQASGIEQVNKAILQIDQTTQQNAALVEQTAAASHALGDQAQELQDLMDFFKLDGLRR